VSKIQNNLNFNEYLSQFYPGPFEYNAEKSFEKINMQNKYRYSSLFKSERSKNKKIKNDSPGPGSYIEINKLFYNKQRLNLNLKRKEKRFKHLFRGSNPISLWHYSTTNDSNINSINDTMDKKNKNNDLKEKNKKDSYDYRHYIIKEEITDKGELKQSYFYDKNYKIVDNEKNNKIIPKSFDNKKFNEKREFNTLIKKYINTNENDTNQNPGPGQYNIYMGFDKILKNNSIEKLKNVNKQIQFIPDKIIKEFSLSKKNQESFSNDSSSIREIKLGKNKSSENIIYPEVINSDKGTFPFLSRRKRIEFHDLLLKHNPGPCYYYNDSFFHNKSLKKKLKH
jgi:hypothetical protein